jgi:hypothetical protein
VDIEIKPTKIRTILRAISNRVIIIFLNEFMPMESKSVSLARLERVHYTVESRLVCLVSLLAILGSWFVLGNTVEIKRTGTVLPVDNLLSPYGWCMINATITTLRTCFKTSEMCLIVLIRCFKII